MSPLVPGNDAMRMLEAMNETMLRNAHIRDIRETIGAVSRRRPRQVLELLKPFVSQDDLGNEDPVHCINCGTEWLPEPVLKSKQPLAFEAAAPVVAKEPAEARTLTVWLMNGSAPDAVISLTYAEFLNAVARLREVNLPIEREPEAAWPHFVGWRVNYEQAAYAIAAAIVAVPALWSGPRRHPVVRT